MTNDGQAIFTSNEFQAYFKTGLRSLIMKANPPYFTVLAVSDDYLSLVQRHRNEVLHKNLFEVFPGSAADLSEKNSVYSSFTRVIKSREKDELPVFKYEIYKAETDRWVTEYWTNVNEPLFDKEGNLAYLVNTTTNITENVVNRKSVQNLNEELLAANNELREINEEMAVTNEELVQSQNDYLKLYDELTRSQADLIFTIQAAGMATWNMNPRTGSFTGNEVLKSWFGLASEEEIPLQKATDIISEKDRSKVVTAILEALQYEYGGKYDIEYTISNPLTGVPRMVAAKGQTQFNERKEAVRFSGILLDITEQKRDEQRKSDFIGMVSHEMKTPLTTLSTYLQMMQVKTKEQDHLMLCSMLEKSNRQVSRITDLINGFLNVSRLESGKIQIDLHRFDMAQLMKEIEEEIKSTVFGDRVIFQPVETTYVNADRDKIGQVITNFISNAVKYSPNYTMIRVACVTLAGSALISVKDEGSGIRDEDKTRIFERYYRVSESQNIASGFGIGLYLCYEIIQRHNGMIWVESEVGKGSTFFFKLPVVE